MTRTLLLLAALGAGAAPPAAAQREAPYTFVVLGHIRGNASGELSTKLPELLGRVKAEHPEFVVLDGDIIWGDIFHDPTRPDTVERLWAAVDSALGTLGVPVYRTPGNHDISDLGSRDVWRRRYGPPNQVIERHGSRFIMLPSAWIPPDGDTRHNPYVRPVRLDSTMVAWLRGALAQPGPYAHTFVFMHHLLWWEDDAPWWTEVHPLLRDAGTEYVFSGDLGPLKFSHYDRDGVHYVQTSMEAGTQLQTLRNLEKSRLLSAQFDNFLVVRVDGPTVDVAVRTYNEFGNVQFTPQRYRDMLVPIPVPLKARLLGMFSVNRVLAGLVVLLAGAGLGWMLARRRAA